MKPLWINAFFIGLSVFVIVGCSEKDGANSQTNESDPNTNIISTQVSNDNNEKITTESSQPSTSVPSNIPMSTLPPAPTATPMPTEVPRQTISQNNIGQLELVDHLGRGLFGELFVDNSGNIIAVQATTGIYLFNGMDLSEILFFEKHSRQHEVYKIALSSDGLRLAVGRRRTGYNDYVEIYQIKGDSLQKEDWIVEAGDLYDFAFTPQGDRLIVLDTSNFQVIDISDGSLINSFPNMSDAGQLIIHPTQEVIATASTINYSPVILYDFSTGNTIGTISNREGGHISDMTFSPDGKQIAIAAMELTVWDVNSRNQLWKTEGFSSDVVFSPDGTQIITTKPRAESFKLYQASDGSLINSYPMGRVLGDVKYMPSGDKIVMTDINGLALRQMPDWQLLAKIDEYVAGGMSMALSPDDKHLVIGGWDGILEMWDITTKNLIQTFEGHTDLINRVTYSPHGNLIASTGIDNTVRVWRVEDGSLYRTLDTNIYNVPSFEGEDDIEQGFIFFLNLLWSKPSGIEFLPDGKRLAITTKESIQIWDLESNNLVKQFSAPGLADTSEQGNWPSFALSPDGTEIAVYDSQEVAIYSIENGEIIWPFYIDMYALDMFYTPDGKDFVILGRDNDRQTSILQIWNTENQIYRKFYDVTTGGVNEFWKWPMRYLNEGDILVFNEGGFSDTNNTIGFFETESGNHIDSQLNIGAFSDYIFTSDETRVIIGDSGKGIIEIWEIASPVGDATEESTSGNNSSTEGPVDDSFNENDVEVTTISVPTILPTSTPTVSSTQLPKLTETPIVVPETVEENIIPLSGKGLTQLTFDNASHYTADFSPDQTKIILSVKSNDYWQIVEMDANGEGSSQRITKENANFYNPHYAPDGQTILVSSDMDGDMDIYQLDVATGGILQQLTNNQGDDYFPRWLPDGEGFIFSSKQDGDDEIYIGRLDGSQEQLTDNTAFDGFASSSPDGQDITFYSDRDGDYEIYIMAINGQNPTRVTTTQGRDADPAFSPDGEWIAFESDRNGNNDIFIIRRDGSDVRQLIDNPYGDWFPVFSPDGDWIMFQSNRSGIMQIYRFLWPSITSNN